MNNLFVRKSTTSKFPVGLRGMLSGLAYEPCMHLFQEPEQIVP